MRGRGFSQAALGLWQEQGYRTTRPDKKLKLIVSVFQRYNVYWNNSLMSNVWF